MKKLVLVLLIAMMSLSQAQVIIGDAVGTAPVKTSVLLDFAKNDNIALPNQSKGIIVPYVRTLPTGAALVGGSIILDATSATASRMKFYNAKTSTWIDISGQDANLTTPVDFMTVQPTLVADASARAIIGAANSTADGVLVLESTTKALLLPIVADVQNIPSPSPGMMVYVNKTGAKRLAVFNGSKWSFFKP
ncbi:hypothetical protein [Halpernia frigidisoli]|uniref:Uncharacterized protein n=1 Tax=Halpernia frigidisoli TaxID=1125876 RepID=A0A1I3FMZ0_9FLAO|nr:hypothetical protein [Halpernia frigidisoli]SFI12540.1 hypothetical protein SAMN05443292_1491 [Halpernia frigidisoli]